MDVWNIGQMLHDGSMFSLHTVTFLQEYACVFENEVVVLVGLDVSNGQEWC